MKFSTPLFAVILSTSVGILGAGDTLAQSGAKPVKVVTEVFNDFNAGNLADLTLLKDAAPLSPAIRVAPSASFKLGAVYLSQPMTLSADRSFSSYFTFRFTDPKCYVGVGADGIGFILSDAAKIGSSGGGIGYGTANTSLVVEYDTFLNDGITADPNNNHVGININGNLKSVKTATPSFLMTDGQTYHTWIDYNGATKSLEVRLSNSITRPASALLAHTIDIAAIIPTKAHLGITASTGGCQENHDILSLIANDELEPGGIVPGVNTYVPAPATVTLNASPVSVVANGIDTATITAVVRDRRGNLMPNQPVTFTTSIGILSATTGLTNKQGEIVLTIKSQVPGQAVINATSGKQKSATTAVLFKTPLPPVSTATATPVPTSTLPPTATATATRTPTAIATATATATRTPLPAATATLAPTATVAPTATPTPTPSPIPTIGISPTDLKGIILIDDVPSGGILVYVDGLGATISDNAGIFLFPNVDPKTIFIGVPKRTGIDFIAPDFKMRPGVLNVISGKSKEFNPYGCPTSNSVGDLQDLTKYARELRDIASQLTAQLPKNFSYGSTRKTSRERTLERLTAQFNNFLFHSKLVPEIAVACVDVRCSQKSNEPAIKMMKLELRNLRRAGLFASRVLTNFVKAGSTKKKNNLLNARVRQIGKLGDELIKKVPSSSSVCPLP